MKRQKKAFTLIELLVVISIIALLVSILMPALNRAKEQAKNVLCLTNVRSLSIGYQMFNDENDEKGVTYNSNGQNNLWLEQVAKKLSNIDEVRYCPSTRDNQVVATTGHIAGSAKEYWGWYDSSPEGSSISFGSYGLNGWLYNDSDLSGITANWTKNKFGKGAGMKHTAEVPVFFDSVWIDAWPNHGDTVAADFDLDQTSQSLPNNMMCRLMVNRHSGNLPVSFVDGHIEEIALKRMWSLKWNKNFQRFHEDKTRQGGTPIYKKN